MRTTLGAIALSVLAVPGAFAQTPIPLTVSGNEARGTISLPGGISADLTISFESVVGLSPSALEASARLVTNLSLLGRLPNLATLPLEFPVLLRIGPSASSNLSFDGVATVTLHTPNLELDPSLPLALFKATNGGPFRDITTWEGAGSYRVGGSTGTFSEFLIVLDLRSIDVVISGKLNALQALLNGNSGSMPPLVATTLQTLLTEASTLYHSGETTAAADPMTAFSNFVIAHSGADIPNVWRANDPTAVNVAGLLRSAADTLKFSLDRKASH